MEGGWDWGVLLGELGREVIGLAETERSSGVENMPRF